MHLEHKDRDTYDSLEAFEGFGEHEDAPEVRTIDLGNSDDLKDAVVWNPNAGPSKPVMTRKQSLKGGFSWAAFAGGLASLVWIGGAIGGPVSFYGIDAIMAMDPALQAGLAALAFGPALLFWIGGAAAGEAVRARRLAAELTRLLNERPSSGLSPVEEHAQRITLNVKGEIEALNDAITLALNRLADLENNSRRNAALFEETLTANRETEHYLVARMANERDALNELRSDMRGETEVIANSVGRQVRLMREASKLVKSEITAAEDALESRFAAFSESASVMAQHTASFHDAADSAAAATASLNGTMSTMLDSLGEATKLTDTARQSAQEATMAASETAAAVRETTRSAVFEAKRAAQAIRAETEALQETAVTTMERLKDAAVAARAAAEESQAAADRHAAQIEKRLAALAGVAGAQKKTAPAAAPAPQVVQQRVEARAPVVEREIERRVEAHAEVGGLYAAAAAAASRAPARAQVRTETVAIEQPRAKAGGLGGLKGVGGWGNFFPQRDMKAANAPEEADAFDLVDLNAGRKDPDRELKADAVELVVAAGVDIDDALTPTDLDNIAQRSRLGAAARRRAVVDAAPNAVSRIARHVKRSSDARAVATEFRNRPDLAKSEKKGETSDLVRAYLLIDAALG